MGEHQVPDDGEAEPGAAQLARARLVDPVEALGDAGQVAPRDADARVGHRHLDPVPGDQRSPDAHVPAARGVLDRVVDQVDQDLDEPVVIGGDGDQARRHGAGEPDASARRPRPDDGHHRVDDLVERGRRQRQRDPPELDVRQLGEVADEAPEPLGVAKDDLEEFPRVLRLFERPLEQGLEIAVNGGERRAELVGHVRHELGAHVLEPPQLGHVVEHHDQAPLVAPERERQRLDLEHAPGRRGEAHLAPQHETGRPRAAVPEQLVQLDVSDHLEKRLALAAHRAEPEDGARPLVHQEDVLVAVHRDDALDHPVEDRGDLRALLLEVLDLLAQPRREDVQRPAERADLVGGARGRADEEIALAHLAGDGLHVDHRARHAAGDEDADAERDQQRHAAAREHHLVERGVGRGDGGQGEREPQHADHAARRPAPARRRRGAARRRVALRLRSRPRRPSSAVRTSGRSR